MIFWKDGGSFSLGGRPVGGGPRGSDLSESLEDIVIVFAVSAGKSYSFN